MKLSHLSIAILSAITLAACGGGGSSQSITNTDSGVKPVDQTPVDQTPVQPMEPTIAEQEVIVDPAQTGVVGKLDFKKESSVGTTQYLRNENSKFDKADNPSEKTSATSIFGVSVNQQNPYLTNIALARLKDSQYPNMTLVQYLGVAGERAPNYGDSDSLQQQNKHNVQIKELTKDVNVVSAWDAFPVGGYVHTQLKNIKEMITLYKKEKTLTPEQQERLKQLLVVQADLQALQAALKANSKFGQGLVLIEGLEDTSKKNYWGDLVETSDNVLAQNGGIINDAESSTGPIANGLVGINVGEDERTPKLRTKLGITSPYRIVGTEENSKSSTRIFGRNFSYTGSAGMGDGKVLNTPNSYKGAITVVEKTISRSPADYNLDNLSNFGVLGTTFDSLSKVDQIYTDAEKDEILGGAKDRTKVRWSLAVEPQSLTYVQYGRVTGNLDPEPFSNEQIEKGEALNYKERPFRIKGADDAVDTYFYRGPDATTVAQMNAVAAKETKPLVYRGHALMYGIDNEFHNTTPDAVPTAFGKTDMIGVGNFVEATVDLGKGRLEKGVVYNVWHEKEGRITIPDPLVKFDGNIYGNTVIGEAQRTYNTSDKADFRASFFGANADELGGSFNSTTYQERYGAKGDVWGGVFGAKRDVSGSTLSNQQLGDIPPLTTKSK